MDHEEVLEDLDRRLTKLHAWVEELRERDRLRMPRELLDEELVAIKLRLKNVEEGIASMLDLKRRVEELQEKGQQWVWQIQRAVNAVKDVELEVKQAVNIQTELLKQVLSDFTEERARRANES